MSEPPIAVTLKLDERALPAEEFEHVSARAGLIAERRVKREEALENFGKPGARRGGVRPVVRGDRQTGRLGAPYETGPNCVTIGRRSWAM